MKSSDLLLARRYAAALFEAVTARDPRPEAVDAAASDLAAAARAAADKARALGHPQIPASLKKALLREGAGTSPLVSRLLDVLVDKKRAPLLAAVRDEFGRLSDQARGIARARVRCAEALGPRESDRLRRALESLSGKRVAAREEGAPELLAGVEVRMGDWVIDGSLAGRLRRLREHVARQG